jgi:hypothetical protein
MHEISTIYPYISHWPKDGPDRNRRFSQVQAVRDRALATCEAAVERLNWENHGILTTFLGDVRVIDDGYPLGIVYVAGWEIPKID